MYELIQDFPVGLLKQLEQEGSINAFIHVAVDYFDRIKIVEPELMNVILMYLDRYIDLITPESFKKLEKLPSQKITTYDLQKYLKYQQRKLISDRTSQMYFPVIASAGQIKEITVGNAGRSRLTPKRLQQMDEVGSAVFSALEKYTGRILFFHPNDYFFMVSNTFGNEDPDVDGRSMDLALGLSLVSFLTQIPLPFNVSATGMVIRSGKVCDVEGIEEKLKTLRRERHFINKVIISIDQEICECPTDLELIPVDRIDDAISKCFPDPAAFSEVFTGIDVPSEVERIKNQYDLYLIDTCIRNSNQIIKYLKSKNCDLPKEQVFNSLFTCYWRKGSCHCHKGDVRKATSELKKASALYEKQISTIKKKVIDEEKYLNSQISYAVLLKDIYRYTAAESLHLEIQDQIKKNNCTAHLEGKNLSSLSQLHLAQSRFDEAEKYQKKALKLINTLDLHRNYGYLAQIYMRTGELKKAERTLEKVKQLLGQAPPDDQRKNLPFYHSFLAEFLYRKILAMKRKSTKTFDSLFTISEKYKTIDRYVPGLIHKWAGLGMLLQGEEDKGLQKLSEVAGFFDEQISPMYKLIGAGVHAQRALFLLKNGLMEKAIADLSAIKCNLSVQKDIKVFFKNEIRDLSKSLRTIKGANIRVGELIASVDRVIEYIPY